MHWCAPCVALTLSLTHARTHTTQVNPQKRLTAQQCLQHQWIVNASLQEDKALGAQHKAFLLIRRLPLFEQVCVFVVCFCGDVLCTHEWGRELLLVECVCAVSVRCVCVCVVCVVEG